MFQVQEFDLSKSETKVRRAPTRSLNTWTSTKPLLQGSRYEDKENDPAVFHRDELKRGSMYNGCASTGRKTGSTPGKNGSAQEQGYGDIKFVLSVRNLPC